MEELQSIITVIGVVAVMATMALAGLAAMALRVVASATVAAGRFTTVVFVALAAGALS